MGHRWDIHLLRAVAVLSVFGYHSGVSHMQGGSLGVDVFFVISGYLITVTWQHHHDRGNTDHRAFMRHRLARTLPAAAVAAAAITVAVALIAWDRWQDMAWHLAASLTASENLLVSGLTWNGWDSPVEALTPYTHFWSMAMEVQFYLVWPILLAAVLGARSLSPARSRQLLLVGLAAVAALSLYAYVAWGVSSHGLAYFSPVTRAWQLAIGAALGLLLPSLSGSARSASGRQRWAVAATLIGLAVLTYCFLFGGFAHETDSPLWGMCVVAATVGLLAVGRWLPPLPQGVARLMAPLLAIGTISYGLYLWHLPVLWTVSELGWDRSPLWWLGVVGVSVAAATLSWHFVEKPAIAWSRRRRSDVGTPASPPTITSKDAVAASRERELVRI